MPGREKEMLSSGESMDGESRGGPLRMDRGSDRRLAVGKAGSGGFTALPRI